MRRRVYIETPYNAPTPEGIVRNIKFLWACMLDSVSRGEAPFASHAVYTQFLSDRIPEHRDIGIECGLAWAQVGAEATVLYENLGISEGMERGIRVARYEGRPVESRKLDWIDPGLESNPDFDRGYIAGLEAAITQIMTHSCVSTCCDAQPSSGEAKELAKCVHRGALRRRGCP